MNELLEVSRVLITFFFLGLSSWYDFKTREVPNKVWAAYAPTAVALTLLQFYVDSSVGYGLIPYAWLISIGITTAISLILFYAGFFGGADAKALICLGLALPIYPSIVSGYLAGRVPFFPLAVLGNAVLAASLLVLGIAGYNTIQLIKENGRLFEGLENEPVWSKILAFATGFKVSSQKLKDGSHYMLLEQFSRGENGEAVRRLRLFPALEEESSEEDEERFEELLNEVDGKVWVTPGLPFLIFITLGFVAALFVGDFISWLVLQVFPVFATV